MVKGRNKLRSIIEINRLEALILELNALGYSYSDIIKEVLTKRKIQLSKSSLTRFFNKHRDLANKYKDSHSRAIGEYSIDISERLMNVINDSRVALKDIESVLNTSSLKPSERVQIKNEFKVIVDELLTVYSRVEHDNLSLMTLLREDYDNILMLMAELSNGMCPNCQRHITNTIREFEK